MLWNKFFCKHYFSPPNTFMRKGNNPNSYLWLMVLDSGGSKTCWSASGSGSPTLVVWFNKKLCNFQAGPGLGRYGAGYWWRCAGESAGQLHWPVHPADQGGHGEDRGPGGRCRDQQGQPAHHVPGNNLFCLLLFEDTCTLFSKIKSRKEVTKQ